MTKIKKPTSRDWLIYWSERQDLNLRPLVPQTSTLPGCATPRAALGMVLNYTLNIALNMICSAASIINEKRQLITGVTK